MIYGHFFELILSVLLFTMTSLLRLSETIEKYLSLTGIHFYFIRHGQSLANHSGSVVGWSDSKLSVKGREQANKLYRAFYPHV